MAAAQDHASKILDAAIKVMAATCARRIAADKLEDARDALSMAEDGRAVSFTVNIEVLHHTNRNSSFILNCSYFPR